MISMLRLFKPLTILFGVIALVAVVSSAVPAEAQSTASPPTNIRVVNGLNPSELIVTWDAAGDATHYRVGCVNMERDYPRAKSSVTGNWRQAFVFVDVDAPNVSPNRATYTLYGLQEGAYHACTVLSNGSRYGQPTWPTPYWQYITVTDHGGSCPAFELTGAPDATDPLSIGQVSQLARPALVHLSYPTEEGRTTGGTGFVVRSDGLVVTNRHVVDDQESLTARLETPDGELIEFTGRVLGKGILTDLAAIKLSSNRPFRTVALGNSDGLAFGDPVTSWGYPTLDFLGTAPTLTSGIISSPLRVWDDTRFIQHNADITGGNSGGPVIDRFGQVIGVNTYSLTNSRGNIAGIYLAVASNEVRDNLQIYEAGGPEQATYRNLRWGYGYGMDLPKGWFLANEGNESLLTQFTTFSAYGGERGADIMTVQFDPPYLETSGAFGAIAGFYWSRFLPLLAEEWHFFQPISPPTAVTIGDQLFARMEYRYQLEEDDCIRSEIALSSLSSDYPNKPYAFVHSGSVCEEVLATYAAERERILYSFRP